MFICLQKHFYGHATLLQTGHQIWRNIYLHLYIINFTGSQFADDEFANANPNKKVPAIQDGDFNLFEW